MILKDDYHKDIILLDEEKLVYKRKFKKITINREEIRSVYYDEYVFGVLTYSGKVYSLNIVGLLFSERKKLEDLRLELNKEAILFDYINLRGNISTLLYACFLPSIINNILRQKSSTKIVLLIILSILIIASFIYAKRLVSSCVYNINTNELEVIKDKNTIKYKKEEIDKINLMKSNNNITIIEFQKNRKKYKLYFRKSPYLIKIYNTSLIKLFK
ncbi:hypothetical protein [Clostridium sp.]|uniref:hypothetical protein n=1 Tax=Clostridium sp. TaxID=1506 RepID=UPI0029062B8D|nr:hypothetical protein [Clostridium sp.]MDU5105748.1 hypothetical protein [Clostridium sp.]